MGGMAKKVRELRSRGPMGEGGCMEALQSPLSGVARLDDSFAAVARLEKVAAWKPYRLHGQRYQKRRQLQSSQ